MEDKDSNIYQITLSEVHGGMGRGIFYRGSDLQKVSDRSDGNFQRYNWIKMSMVKQF